MGHHVFHTDLRILRNLNAVSFVARADFPMDSSVTPPNQTLITRKIYRPEKHLIGDWSFQMFFKGSIITSSISSSTFTHFIQFHPISPWIIPDFTKPVPPFPRPCVSTAMPRFTVAPLLAVAVTATAVTAPASCWSDGSWLECCTGPRRCWSNARRQQRLDISVSK